MEHYFEASSPLLERIDDGGDGKTEKRRGDLDLLTTSSRQSSERAGPRQVLKRRAGTMPRTHARQCAQTGATRSSESHAATRLALTHLARSQSASLDLARSCSFVRMSSA
eukprot:6173673-Pleurochrysis_carterae.AAC.1